MVDTSMQWLRNNPKLIPALIVSISIAVIVLNYLVLQASNTLLFDSLFYFPIILVSYYYPRRGVFITAGIAVVYIAMVMAIPHQSLEIIFTSLEHAGFFVIVGYSVSYLTIRPPKDLGIYRRLAEIVEPSKIKGLYIPAFIIILSAIVIFLNYLVLQISHTVIFDPLFCFPIIFTAYFYPQRGITASTGITTIYLATVMMAPYRSPEILFTSLGHAGIFIIIGYVISFLSIRFSQEVTIHKHLADMVVFSSDAIIGKTLEGTVTDWNNGAEHLYGYTAQEVIGKSINLLLPPELPEEFNTLLEKVRQGDTIERREIEQMTKDRRQISVSLSISPIINDRGDIIGASTIAHDITDRKRAEKALEKTSKKLHLLNDITRHDILNKITALFGYLELSTDMVKDPILVEYNRKELILIKEIQKQIEFTRSYQNIGVKLPEWQNVHKIMLAGASPVSTGSIAIEPCDKAIEIYADPLLEKVFYNLIDNSVRYGEKLTRIRCTHQEDGQGLTLMYEDNGIGIPAEDKQKIFKKGFGQNTGLGLFLVEEILAITAITIAENGEPGKGSRFEIRVPKGMYRFTPPAEPVQRK
jgi:PAS domain S-box-containing protein